MSGRVTKAKNRRGGAWSHPRCNNASSNPVAEEGYQARNPDSTVTPEVREMLVKFKKFGCKGDPFHPDAQGIIDKLVDVSNSIAENSRAGKPGVVSLTEAALLLDCSVKVYCEQVDRARDEVLMAAKKLSTPRSTDDSNSEVIGDGTGEWNRDNTMACDERKFKEILECQHPITNGSIPEAGAAIFDGEVDNGNSEGRHNDTKGEVPVVSTICETSKSQCDAETVTIIEDDELCRESNSSASLPLEEQAKQAQATEVMTVRSVDNEAEFRLTGTVLVPKTETTATGGTEIELQHSTSPTARKRIKKDYGPPPILRANIGVCDSDTCAGNHKPPSLMPSVRKRKERCEARSIDAESSFEFVTRERPSCSKHGALYSNSEPSPHPPDMENSKMLASESSSDFLPNTDFMAARDVSIKTENDEGVHRALIPPCETKAENFTAEDEAKILGFIKQIHYLPFTCELTKEELAKTFNDAVIRLQAIYHEHQVPIHRRAFQAASDVCAHISNSYGKWVEAKSPFIPDITELHELFSQRIVRQTPSSKDMELTIWEAAEEKTKIQSDSKLQEMLKEIQRLIVPKYMKIPLIEENTEGFFRRVKDFKNRMKKVLAEEEKKPDFDIREYEMEVLDVAKKEEQELSHVILSPDPDLTPALSLSLSPNVSRSPVASDLIPEFNSRVYFDGLPRPSASSHSEEGLKWVSLKHIFAHMKTLDRQEAARMFYAVLALLSFRNLDMKYTNLYSRESANLVEKAMDHGVMDNKYSSGMKIMTSRCANVDNEDVYIAALEAKSRTELFEELESLNSPLPEECERENLHPKNIRVTTNESLPTGINQATLHDICRELQLDIRPYATSLQRNSLVTNDFIR